MNAILFFESGLKNLKIDENGRGKLQCIQTLRNGDEERKWIEERKSRELAENVKILFIQDLTLK